MEAERTELISRREAELEAVAALPVGPLVARTVDGGDYPKAARRCYCVDVTPLAGGPSARLLALNLGRDVPKVGARVDLVFDESGPRWIFDFNRRVEMR